MSRRGSVRRVPIRDNTLPPLLAPPLAPLRYYTHRQTDLAVARETALWQLASVMTSLSRLLLGRETQTFIKLDYVSQRQRRTETENHHGGQKKSWLGFWGGGPQTAPLAIGHTWAFRFKWCFFRLNAAFLLDQR